MARSRVEKRPQAIRDLGNIAEHLAKGSGNAELALRFFDAAETSFEHLADAPGIGATRLYNDPDLASVRMWRVAGFPNHLIFYREFNGGVEIVRVLHGKRDIQALFGGESVAETRPVYEAGGAEKALRELEERGVLTRATAPKRKLKPIARKPGSLKRFLKSRE